MGYDSMDLEDAVTHAMPPELDRAYPGVRDRLLAELALLRSKAAAMDWLAATAYHIRLTGGGTIVAITFGEKYRVIRSDGTWEDGCASLLAASENAREVSGA